MIIIQKLICDAGWKEKNLVAVACGNPLTILKQYSINFAKKITLPKKVTLTLSILLSFCITLHKESNDAVVLHSLQYLSREVDQNA